MRSHSVTCHPTQVNVPCLNPSHAGRYSIYLPTTEGWKAELTLVLVIYWDGLPVRRQSPIQVLTTWSRPDRESNPRPRDRKSNVLPVTLPCHHRAALISVSLALSQTTVYTARSWLVHRTVCLFTSQLLLVLIAPTHGGMARLSWPGWLVTYWDGLPACRRSPIQVLTGPGID